MEMTVSPDQRPQPIRIPEECHPMPAAIPLCALCVLCGDISAASTGYKPNLPIRFMCRTENVFVESFSKTESNAVIQAPNEHHAYALEPRMLSAVGSSVWFGLDNLEASRSPILETSVYGFISVIPLLIVL